MYKTADKTQTFFLDFNHFMGFKMNPANRWIQMADKIPWDLFEVRIQRVLLRFLTISSMPHIGGYSLNVV